MFTHVTRANKHTIITKSTIYKCTNANTINNNKLTMFTQCNNNKQIMFTQSIIINVTKLIQ